eukprot:TRINITY_DN58729_c0_g1_i1.p1 TRINITY_DN58729_c0_g1~~TRINITY_DN58729_c0_g1_i1.p1  ORF type:complete len:310 (-),score=55.77 TRINITY_DN58729_c0_g1_i1:492-1373(-)
MESFDISVPASVVNFWESLLADESEKDIELTCKDGTVWAHSLILKSMSEPLKRMLNSDMAERQSKKIALSSFTVAQVRLVLRFTCTGHISLDECSTASGAKEQKASSPASSTAGSSEAAVLGHVPTLPARSMFGQGTLGVPAGLPNFSGWVGPLPPVMPPLPPALPTQERVSPFLTGVAPRWETVNQKPTEQVPWEVLAGALAFAKQYQMIEFLSSLVECAKRRIQRETFEEIMADAISLDVSPLKMACLDFARNNLDIKTCFEAKTLSAPVLFELCALWPQRPPEKKRLRLS